MTICSDHETSFWMDIHGELGPEERPAWEKHLAVCDACREERTLVIRMMGQIRDVLKPQPLSNAALTAMVNRIAEKSEKGKSPAPVPKRRRLIPGVVIPAAAAACALLVLVFFSLKASFPVPGQMNVPVADLNEGLQTEDLEIIENMELLTEFETLQQLVQMVEDQNDPPQTEEEIHGEIDAQRELTYG